MSDVPSPGVPPSDALSSNAPSSNVVVRFRVPGPRRVFNADAPLSRGEQVVVSTERGPEVGEVLAPGKAEDVPEGRVVRTVNATDEQLIARRIERENTARGVAKERIRSLNLAMKLIAVEINHDATLATFSFTSPERVDFRALIKELSGHLKMRVELRQIGVRDAARYTGGTGSCGRTLCCATWLPEFQPISIRMAKDQGLALNQQKLSGLCGRLRCCLQYEQSTYQAQRKELPKLGAYVRTPRGDGRVKDVNVLRGTIRVALMGEGPAEFRGNEVSAIPAPGQNPGGHAAGVVKDAGVADAAGPSQAASAAAERPAHKRKRKSKPKDVS